MNRDAAFGIAGLVLASVYYAMAAAVPESQLADAVGPAGLPKIYAVVLAGLSLMLIAGRHGAGREDRPHGMLRALGLLVLGAAYIVIVPIAGYIVSIAALIAATTWYQARTMNVRILLVAAAGALLFWLLFVVLLGVPHPSGLWSS